MKHILLSLSICVMSICAMEKKETSESKAPPVVPPIDTKRVRFISIGSKKPPKYSPKTEDALSCLKKSERVWDMQEKYRSELKKVDAFHRVASGSKSAIVRESVTP